MKLEEILQEWEKDAKIDRTKLDEEDGRIPLLHHKYLSYFTKERLLLRKLEYDMRVLRLQKHEHYTQGAKPENKDWKLPPRGMIIKSDAPMYIDADEHVGQLQLRIDYTKEKVEALESIIKQINNRGYLLKNMLDFARWTGGG